ALPAVPGTEGDLHLNATLPAASLRPEGPVSLRGRSIEFHKARLDLGPDGEAEARGTLKIREDGLADAELTVSLIHAEGVGRILARIFPQLAPSIEMAAGNLARL